jgi:glycine cleavage system H protein
MEFPDHLVYTPEHEWVQVEGALARVGITDHAQDALGDVVYVQLPEPGIVVTAGDPVAEIESTKSVSAIYAPVSGTISAVNDALTDTPEIVNADPYGAGWIFEIEISVRNEIAGLLTASEYERSLS